MKLWVGWIGFHRSPSSQSADFIPKRNQTLAFSEPSVIKSPNQVKDLMLTTAPLVEVVRMTRALAEHDSHQKHTPLSETGQFSSISVCFLPDCKSIKMERKKWNEKRWCRWIRFISARAGGHNALISSYNLSFKNPATFYAPAYQSSPIKQRSHEYIERWSVILMFGGMQKHFLIF